MANIADGYGGSLEDGYGGFIDDGYGSGGGSPSLPVLSRIQALYATASPLPFQGRASRRFAPLAPAIPAAPPLSSGPRVHLLYAPHEPSEFAGRASPRVAIGPPPVPPVAGKPFPGRDRISRAFAQFFEDRPFKGRRGIEARADYGGGTGNAPRATIIVAEALARGNAGTRASQLIAAALGTFHSGVRTSQIVAEALYQAENPAYVRASQLVVEVLVPFTELPLIPIYPELQALTWDYSKRAKQSVGRGIASSGREIGVNYWRNPQWEWDLSYDVLGDTGQNVGPDTQSDIKTMIGFFLSQVGTFWPFFFKDPDDNTVVGQVIGTGDGLTTTFVFQRTYGLSTLGPFEGSEPVGGLDERTIDPAVYVGGVLVESGLTIDTSTPYGNTVTFSVPPAPGVPVTADFGFFYFCRLKEDTLEWRKYSTGLWELKKATIFSLKG